MDKVTGQSETVADAMLRSPKLCGPRATVSDLRRLFVDDHVHAALVVDDGRLLTVVERSDLTAVPADRPARDLGRLDGRTVHVGDNLDSIRRWMCAAQIRRLAVVDRQMTLLGLLCLKGSGIGFCSDSGVAARAAEREASARQKGDVTPEQVVVEGFSGRRDG